MANISELLTGWSFGKQSDIVTANTTNIWRQTNLNRKPWAQNPVAEDDANEIGKGHEFATQLFKSHYDDPGYEVQKYLSAEIAAFGFAYGLGNVVKTGSSPNFIYTITPALPATNPTALELPYFTFIQQIRPGGSAVMDQLRKGCAMRSVRLSLRNSPGRASATITLGMVTTGQYTEPSAVTLPAQAALHEMQVGNSTLLINGIDYIATKGFLSADLAWDNNFRTGFYPGSGAQDGFQTQGRFEIGDRALTLSYAARFQNGSTELTKLRALTTGTAVITTTNDTNNNLSITLQKMAFKMAEVDETDGIVTINVTGSQIYDATNGLITVVAKCAQDGICQ